PTTAPASAEPGGPTIGDGRTVSRASPARTERRGPTRQVAHSAQSDIVPPSMAKAAKKKNPPEGDRLIAQNRRARHEFELGKAFEAGVALIGSEARALRE